MTAETPRPAFYALAPGGWRDWVTLLHPPYTAWHLSYVAIGAALAPSFDESRLLLTVAAFFLAVGIGAHALDELNGRPLGTRISDAALRGAAAASIGGAIAIGVYAALELDALARPARRRRRVHRRRVQPRARRGPLPLRRVVRPLVGRLSRPHRVRRARRAARLGAGRSPPGSPTRPASASASSRRRFETSAAGHAPSRARSSAATARASPSPSKR